MKREAVQEERNRGAGGGGGSGGGGTVPATPRDMAGEMEPTRYNFLFCVIFNPIFYLYNIIVMKLKLKNFI